MTPSSRIFPSHSLPGAAAGLAAQSERFPRARRNTTGSVRLDSRCVNRVVVPHPAVGHGLLVVLGGQASPVSRSRWVPGGRLLAGSVSSPPKLIWQSCSGRRSCAPTSSLWSVRLSSHYPLQRSHRQLSLGQTESEYILTIAITNTEVNAENCGRRASTRKS